VVGRRRPFKPTKIDMWTARVAVDNRGHTQLICYAYGSDPELSDQGAEVLCAAGHLGARVAACVAACSAELLALAMSPIRAATEPVAA
jgi:hypothetical protein